jgi:branched-subunit amino acid transport protein AzlD
MNRQYILIAVIISALCTFSLRLLPFLAMSQKSRQSDNLSFLGRILPPAIMAVLIVYCLKDIPTDIYAIGIPKIVGVLTTGISYLWKHNTFVSIILGTVIYMVFIQFI